MPFKDTPDGQTHSHNDGCGEPAHNQTPDQVKHQIANILREEMTGTDGVPAAVGRLVVLFDRMAEVVREEALKPFRGTKNPGEWEDSVWWDAVKHERDRIWHEHLGLGKPIREVINRGLSPNN